jgi:hypothetical protein
VDPIQEADKMGTIMAVLRMGNMDLEMMPAGAVRGAPEAASVDGQGEYRQVSFQAPDGEAGQLVPPMPIGPAGQGQPGIPNAMLVAGGGMPGQPAGMPAWGVPYTGTPIGLPGPTHLPYGGPAGLKSHTVINRTATNIPDPVDHMVIGVKHNPGVSLPPPVKSVEYEETHPVYSPGELSYPAWAAPGGPGTPGPH